MDDKKTTEKPIPTIELGGRVWFLKINHRVLERFSAISKCSMEAFLNVIERYDMMVLLLWLMMCETRQDLTRGGLTDWLNNMPVFEAVNLVTDAVSKAIEYSFPNSDSETDETPAEDADETEPGNPTNEDI